MAYIMHMLRSGAVRAQSCVKVEVDVLGSLSVIVLMVFCGRKTTLNLNSGSV